MGNNNPAENLEQDSHDVSPMGMVKCPSCGKMVSKQFPYCEFCTFPIGEMLQRGAKSNFIANELKAEKKRRAQGRRTALDSVRMSRSTVVRVIELVILSGLVIVGYMTKKSLKSLFSLQGGNENTNSRVVEVAQFKEVVENSRPMEANNNPKPSATLPTEDVYGSTLMTNSTPSLGYIPTNSESIPMEANNNPKPSAPLPIEDVHGSTLMTNSTPSSGYVPTNSESIPIITESTPTKQIWEHPKSWYETQYKEILHNMVTLCSGGYIFDESEATIITQQIKTLQEAISKDNASTCNIVHHELVKHFKTFSESCKWQQGLKHAKFPHIISSYQCGVWNAEEGYEFVKPGTSDLSVKEKTPQLSHPVDWYIRECDVISKNVTSLQKVPYSYDKILANQVLSKARHLREVILSEPPNVVDSLCVELQNSYRQFKLTCKWCSGIRHPSIAHVISSPYENTWEAESGWEFIYPETSNLAVRKKKATVIEICNKCKGNGRIIESQRCIKCNGSGKIKNPVAEVNQVVKDVAEIFGGEKGRRIRKIPSGPKYIPCVDCAGRGRIQFGIGCNNCGGTGKIYK